MLTVLSLNQGKSEVLIQVNARVKAQAYGQAYPQVSFQGRPPIWRPIEDQVLGQVYRLLRNTLLESVEEGLC